MHGCNCQLVHTQRRIVLTGGPGAGKTAVLELARQAFCKHVSILPESASILFGGGFPRRGQIGQLAATQRAIFHVQRELEAMADLDLHTAITLCDRGTVDGAAYWPGPGSLFAQVGTTHDNELHRYDMVLHLRTPRPDAYNHQNPMRTETAVEAAAIDDRIAEAWSAHPRVIVVDSTHSFLEKAQRAVEILRAEVPACCRNGQPVTA
jgi:predicted ATPase